MIRTEWSTQRKYLLGKKNFAKLNKRVTTYTGYKFSAVVSVAFVSDRTMRSLYEQWTGVSSTTDVLAFPFNEDKQMITGSTNILGEVIICFEQARRQALAHGHSLRNECRLLYIHGLLHLLGYDHRTKQQTRLMRQLEQKIFLG